MENNEFEQQLKEQEDSLVKVLFRAGATEDEARREARKQIDTMGSTKTIRGECPIGGASPMSCMFCPYGHMIECHYPQDCEEARCSHYLSEQLEDGLDIPDEWEDIKQEMLE